MGERKGPCLYISGLLRSTTKAAWKYLYRYARVLLRETEKRDMDMLLYGTGYMQYNLGEDPKHIPIQEVTFDARSR